MLDLRPGLTLSVLHRARDIRKSEARQAIFSLIACAFGFLLLHQNATAPIGIENPIIHGP